MVKYIIKNQKHYLLGICLSFYLISCTSSNNILEPKEPETQTKIEIDTPTDITYSNRDIIIAYKSDSKKNIGSSFSLLASEDSSHIVDVELLKDQSVEDAIAECPSDPNILYCEPNYILYPNDVFISNPKLDNGELWGFNQTNIRNAWQITEMLKDSENIIVAVIDSGVNVNHPDLASHIWINEDEISNNGIDDDENGYIDDIHGVDFTGTMYDNNRVSYSPIDFGVNSDDSGHGTHVAGTIAGNIGVNPHVKIMVLKFLHGNIGYTSNARLAIEYAINNNAYMSNNSWGSYSRSRTLLDILNTANNKGHLFIAAAGNGNNNNDNFQHYPSGYNLDNIISVAASDEKNNQAYFSNYGQTSVDIAAPGVNILSTGVNSKYTLKSGTSMAAPLVAGIISLSKLIVPDISINELKSNLIKSVNLYSDFDKRTVSGGIVDAYKFLKSIVSINRLWQTNQGTSFKFNDEEDTITGLKYGYLWSKSDFYDVRNNKKTTISFSLLLEDTDSQNDEFSEFILGFSENLEPWGSVQADALTLRIGSRRQDDFWVRYKMYEKFIYTSPWYLEPNVWVKVKVELTDELMSIYINETLKEAVSLVDINTENPVEFPKTGNIGLLNYRKATWHVKDFVSIIK